MPAIVSYPAHSGSQCNLAHTSTGRQRHDPCTGLHSGRAETGTRQSLKAFKQGKDKVRDMSTGQRSQGGRQQTTGVHILGSPNHDGDHRPLVWCARACPLSLLTITFRGVAPDTWHTADTGMVVLAEDVAQLTLVFSQCTQLGGVERSLGMLHLTGDATVDLCGETGDE